MKKKLLALLLAVMTVATIVPTMLLPTAAIDYYNGYETAMVSSGAINVDGSAIPDAAYLNSEKIVSTQHSNNLNSSGETSSFYGYTAADEMGLFLWVKITDQSLDKGEGYLVETIDPETYESFEEIKYLDAWQGDRLELYIKASGAQSNASRAVGVFGFDYLGQMMFRNPAFPLNYTNINGERLGFNTELVDFDTTVLEDESAWVAEMYLPWEALGGDFVNFTVDDFTGFQIGFMVTNATNSSNPSNKAYSYDTKHGGSYYRGTYASHAFSTGDASTGWRGSHCVPLSFAGFRTAVVNNAPAIDGYRDAAYLKSEVIDAYDACGGGKNFTAYTAATLEGYYVYVDVIDDTLDKLPTTTIDRGDKVQIYFQMGNRFSNRDWGYVEMDYRTAAECDSAVANAVPFRFVVKGAFADNAATPKAEDFRYATTRKADGSGWTAELFIPWAGRMKDNNFDELTGTTMVLAINVMNYTNEGSRITYCLSDAWAGSAWYANGGSSGDTSGNFYCAPVYFDFETEGAEKKIIRIANYSASDLVLDGEKDSAYSENAVDLVDNVYVQSYGATDELAAGWHYGDFVIAKAYYTATDTDAYVYVEVYDDTVAPSKTGDTLAVYFENSETIAKFNISPFEGGTFNGNTNYQGKAFAFPTSNAPFEVNDSIAFKLEGEDYNSYTGYAVEFRMPLPEAERAALAAGKAINIGIGVEVINTNSDGNRLWYGHSAIGGNLWWQPGNDILGHTAMPKVRLEKNASGGDHTHKWDNGEITTEPTYTTEGIITYTCECGATKAETIPVIEQEKLPCVEISAGEMSADGTVQLTVSLKNNPGLWALVFRLPINSEAFDFVSADTSGSVFTKFGICEYHETKGAYMFNGMSRSLFETIDSDGTVVVITLKVKEGAASGDYVFGALIDEKNTVDLDGKVKVESKSCAVNVNIDDQHICEFGDWQKYDGIYHIRYCECGKNEYGNHYWEYDEVIIREATHLVKGEVICTCMCGEAKHVYTDKLPEHEWDEGTEIVAPTYSTTGIMRYTCPCGAKRDEKIPQLVDVHVVMSATEAIIGDTVKITVSLKKNTGLWSLAFSLPVDTDVFEFVSADTSGSIFKRFGICNYDESTNEYKFNGLSSSDFNSVNATGTVVVITLKVKDDAVAGKYVLNALVDEINTVNINHESVKTESTPLTLSVTDHVCKFGAWEYYDKATHVRYCACGEEEYAEHTASRAVITHPTHTEFGYRTEYCECDSGRILKKVRLDKLPDHEWDNGKVTVQPTHLKEGERTYTCPCGDTYTDVIEKLPGHTFGEWSEFDSERHVHYCECGEAEYQKHSYTRSVTLQPTHLTEGEETYTCNCGYAYTKVMEKLSEHTFGEWSEFDSERHVHYCECGEAEYQKHSYKANVTLQPTHLTEGSATYTCPCGNTYTKVIEKLPDHTFGEWKEYDDENHAHYCACGEAEYEKHSHKATVTLHPTHLEEGEKTFKCACGASYTEVISPLPGHTFGAWKEHDEATHARYCECGETEYRAHVWGKGNITRYPTHLEEGERTYKCACGASYTEAISPLPDHTFGAWREYDDEVHVRYCECGETESEAHRWDNGTDTLEPTHITAGVRTFKCECNATCTEEIEPTPEHEWDDGEVTLQPTHLTEGEKTFNCPCGASYTEAIKKLPGHTFGAWEEYDDGNHVRYCACGEADYEEHNHKITDMVKPTHLTEGSETHTCHCGNTYTKVIKKISTHTFGEWSEFDSETHVRCCECGKTEYEAHAWDGGTITRQPTHLAEGEKTFNCPCGASYTEAIGKLLGHTFSKWSKYDDGNHYRYCACGETEYEAHIWNMVSVTRQPTHLEEGEKTIKCACGASYTEPIEKLLGHTFSKWIEVDGGNHYRYCACGETEYEAHAWNMVSVTRQPTHLTAGEKTIKCACGASYTEEIPPLPGHTFGNWNEYDEGNHYRYCECGETEYKPHSFDGGVVTTNPTHLKEGVKTYTCACKATYTETISPTPDHSWYGKVVTLPATHLTEGEWTYKCACGATYTEAIPPIPTHTYGEWIDFNAYNHVHYCECGAKELNAHVWDNGTVTLEPTYVAEGEMTQNCECGAVLKTAIPRIKESTETPKLIIDGGTTVAGNTVKITIKLENNPGIWSFAFSLPVDGEIFEFVSADTSGSIFKQFGICGYDESTNEYKFNGYNSSLSSNIASDGKLVTLTLKVKEGVATGEYKLAAALNERDIVDIDQNLIKFASVEGTITVTDYVLGDVNGDGYVSNADVLCIFRYIYNSKLYPLTVVVADVNRDGFVTNADVLCIFRYIYNPNLYPIV